MLLPMMSRPVIPPRAMSESVSLPQLGSMFMSMACVTTKDQIDACCHLKRCYHLGPTTVGSVLMSVPCVTTKGHADAHGLVCHLRACDV